MWDRPDSRLSELIEPLNAANAIADRAERDKALAAIRAAAPPGPRRVFLGKNGADDLRYLLRCGSDEPTPNSAA